MKMGKLNKGGWSCPSLGGGMGVLLLSMVVMVRCHLKDGVEITTLHSISDNNTDDWTTENRIPIFPSTTFASASSRQRYKHPHETSHHQSGDLRKKRLLKFLRNFRLDFSKFDTTCIKREGRGLSAPPVSNARVIKYTRRRNRAKPRNYYAMVLFECEEGFEFPMESSDRMFCSRNKWVGPTPVCLVKGTLDESECSKCEQICSHQYDAEESQAICSCYSGYEMMENGTCFDIDECKEANGGCDGICFNQPGSFQCFCPSGYQVGPDGKNCIDKNECLLRNGHGPCQDACTNAPGSYICSCERISGTKLALDKHSCEDINECAESNNFGCSHMCLNTFGNAFCACPKGLVLSSDDYKTCIDEDPEPLITSTSMAPIVLPPPENLEMLNTVADCPPGSALDSENSLICVEHDDCSVDNGGCEHICISSGNFRICSCRTGYELINETSCVDVNECEVENGGCDQECVNIPGAFFCTCKPGYTLKEDERTCQAKQCETLKTLAGASGWDCEYPADSYDKSPVTGTRCVLRCLPGFSLKSVNEITHVIFGRQVKSLGSITGDYIHCNEDGNWSPSDYLSLMTCGISSCKNLPKPEHGSLFPDICSSDNAPMNTQCLVLCSTGYYPKNGRLRTCSKEFEWFPTDNPLCVRLPTTPRPYIHCPSDVEVELLPGVASAYVKIPQPQANMDWYRYVEADPPWAKSLEWEAPAGVTQVVFTARSPVSNDTATCRFKIHVVDREAPRVQGCPTSFEVRLSPGETSREIWWSEPKFTDNVKLHYVQQSHSPGHMLSRGTHHISFTAGDAEGNKARCSFTITVHGSEDYEMADYSFYTSTNSLNRHMIVCPNLKTGRWTIHYAYYLPPGCRYSSSQGLFSKLFKQNSFKNSVPRFRRRTFHNLQTRTGR